MPIVTIPIDEHSLDTQLLRTETFLVNNAPSLGQWSPFRGREWPSSYNDIKFYSLYLPTSDNGNFRTLTVHCKRTLTPKHSRKISLRILCNK